MSLKAFNVHVITGTAQARAGIVDPNKTFIAHATFVAPHLTPDMAETMALQELQSNGLAWAKVTLCERAVETETKSETLLCAMLDCMRGARL